MTLGEKIAALRKERHWSQLKLSQMLGFGNRSSSITRWETNRFRPTSAMLQKLAELFEVRVDDLLGDNTELPTATSQDKRFVEKVQQLRELDTDDRAVIYHIIETYSAQRRIAQMATPRARLEELRK